MSDEQNNNTGSPPPRVRRSSFAGQTFADLFGTGRPPMPRNSTAENNSPPPQQYPGPITTAAAQAQRRRLSLTTLGLNNSPSQSAPFSGFRGRRDSLSSADSGSIDESAIEDEPTTNAGPNTPATPFARRMSFGARAMRDIRNSSGGSGPSSPGQNGASEGFNWSDNLRNRAERTSISAASVAMPPSPHSRAKSVAAMEQPIREMPKEPKRPDHFQERILKGDFYMD